MWIIVTRIVVDSGLSIVLEKQVGAQEFCVLNFCLIFFHLLFPSSPIWQVRGILSSVAIWSVSFPPFLTLFTFLFPKCLVYCRFALLSSLYQGFICFVVSSRTFTFGYGFWKSTFLSWRALHRYCSKFVGLPRPYGFFLGGGGYLFYPLLVLLFPLTDSYLVDRYRFSSLISPLIGVLFGGW